MIPPMHGPLASLHLAASRLPGGTAVWGSLPAWIGAFSTFLALFLIFRDRKQSVRAQANQLAYTFQETYYSSLGATSVPWTATVSVMSTSNLFLTNVYFIAEPTTQLRRGFNDDWEKFRYRKLVLLNREAGSKVNSFFDSVKAGGDTPLGAFTSAGRVAGHVALVCPILRPSEEEEARLELLVPFGIIDFYLVYQDGNNRLWQRNLKTGRLRPARRRFRHKVRLQYQERAFRKGTFHQYIFGNWVKNIWRRSAIHKLLIRLRRW